MCVLLPCKYKNKFERIVAAALRCDRSSASMGHQEEIRVIFEFAVKMSATESRRRNALSKLIFLKKGHPQWRKMFKAVTHLLEWILNF